MLSANPVRAVAVYGSVRPAAREFLDPLFDRMDPPAVVGAVWEMLSGDGSSPAIAAPIAGLVRRAARGLTGPPQEECAGPDRAVAASAQALWGVIASRAGDPEAAVQILGPVCAPGRAAGGLAPREAFCCARELFLAASALGDLEAAGAAVATLLELGQKTDSACKLAELVAAWQADAAELGGVLRTVLERAGDGAGPWLEEVWSALRRMAAAGRRLRRGYFAGELRRLESLVAEIGGQLGEDDGVARALGLERTRALCARVAAHVAELIGELVVYQPLRPEPFSPRRVALEVVVSSREELASDGVTLAAEPGMEGENDGNGPGPLPVTDCALVRSVLRQVLRRIGRAARRSAAAGDGGAGPGLAVTAGGWVEGGRPPRPAPAPAARFRITVAGPKAPRRTRAGGGGRSRQVSAASAVPALLQESTVPDALSRVRGRMRLSGGTAGVPLELTFVFPSLSAGEGSAAGELPAELPPDLRAGAVGSPEGCRRLAEFLLQRHRAARERELGGCGEELGILLHDLKNSLAFVAGWLSGGATYDSETVRRRSLESIEDVQFRLSEAGEMLARPEGSRGPYTDVRASVRRVLRGLAAVAAQKDVRLEIDLPPAAPLVPVESFRAASVIRNLAKNGLEACPPGTRLTVGVDIERIPGMVCVTVRDSGPGFPPEVLAAGGLGREADGLSRPRLGLLSARRIIEESGGRLLLENDGGGEATAAFPAEGQTARLSGETAAWTALADDVRRAVRAAAAMAAAGDGGMARHLWRKALEIQSGELWAQYRRHEFLPRASRMLGPGGGDRLSPEARTQLAAVYDEPGELTRACRRAAALLVSIVRDRFRPKDAGPGALALLVLLGGVPAADPVRVTRALRSAERLLEDQAAETAAVERAVLEALESLALLGS